MKQLPWAICTVLLIVFLIQQLTKPDVVAKQQYDNVEQRRLADSASYFEYRKKTDAALEDAKTHAIQATNKLQQSQGDLAKWKSLSVHLQAKLNLAENEKPDCTWVKVSAAYKDGCDSLRLVNAGLVNQVEEFQLDNQDLFTTMGYEIGLRDTALEKERIVTSMLQASLHDCIQIGKKQQATNQPRAQIYLGGKWWGNKINPFGGAEINATLKTKGNRMYDVSGAWIQNNWWVGGGAKILLHF